MCVGSLSVSGWMKRSPKSTANIDNSESYAPENDEDDQSDIDIPASDEISIEEDDVEEVRRIKHTKPKQKAKSKGSKTPEVQPESVMVGDLEFVWQKPGIDDAPDDMREFRPPDNNASRLDRFKLKDLIGKSILSFFFLIFPITFWDKVVINTNQYAAIHADASWSPMVLYELLLFLAILLLYSVRNTPRIKDLWRKDPLFICPLIGKMGMTYSGWAAIRKFLHLSPVVVPEEKKDDKYFKVRIMIEELVINSKVNHPYSKYWSLDEMTIGYQGRTYLIKRTPSKKVPKGFQCIALSTDFGYVVDMHFDMETVSTDYPDLSPTGNRVMKLCSFLKTTNKYAHVFMDNRFSTPLLFYYLLKHLFVYATGTWRQNYGVPEMIRIVARGVAAIQAAKEFGVNKCFTTYDGVKLYGISLYDNSVFYMLTSAYYSFEAHMGGTKNISRYVLHTSYSYLTLPNS